MRGLAARPPTRLRPIQPQERRTFRSQIIFIKSKKRWQKSQSHCHLTTLYLIVGQRISR